MVHPQNSLPEPLVVCCRSIHLSILAHSADVILSQLILLNRDVAIGAEDQDLVDEVVRMSFVRLTLAWIVDRVLCQISLVLLCRLILLLRFVFVDENLEQVGQDLHSFLDLAFDEVQHTFCEVLVHRKSL